MIRSYLADLRASMETTEAPRDAKTGWPAPALAQDDHRPLFKWFASKPDARRLVREAASDTLRERMQAEHIEKRAESGTWFVVVVILCFLAAMLVPHWGL